VSLFSEHVISYTEAHSYGCAC